MDTNGILRDIRRAARQPETFDPMASRPTNAPVLRSDR
jgi:hypothetical protein